MEDEHMMREYLREGDLISAEVQNVQNDGSLSLHTRSLRYGKVSKSKNHSSEICNRKFGYILDSNLWNLGVQPRVKLIMKPL